MFISSNRRGSKLSVAGKRPYIRVPFRVECSPDLIYFRNSAAETFRNLYLCVLSTIIIFTLTPFIFFFFSDEKKNPNICSIYFNIVF